MVENNFMCDCCGVEADELNQMPMSFGIPQLGAPRALVLCDGCFWSFDVPAGAWDSDNDTVMEG